MDYTSLMGIWGYVLKRWAEVMLARGSINIDVDTHSAPLGLESASFPLFV